MILWTECFSGVGAAGVGVGGFMEGGPFKLHARASKGMNFQRGSSPRRPKHNSGASRSSRIYPSMLQFVITGVIGRSFEMVKWEVYCNRDSLQVQS